MEFRERISELFRNFSQNINLSEKVIELYESQTSVHILSFITELELLGYKGIKKEEEKTVKEFVDQCKVIGINDEIKQKTIYIRKAYNIKLPDSIIIATSIYLDLPLVTSDADFKKAGELKLLLYQN